METIKLSSLMIDRVEEAKGMSNVFDAWFSVEGELVCWIRHSFKEEKLELWAIETRPGYLNQGVARSSLFELKFYYDVPEIYHNGSYTPEGSSFVAKYFTHTKDPRSFPEIKSQSFVERWNYFERVSC